jgi:hypothetical protein
MQGTDVGVEHRTPTFAPAKSEPRPRGGMRTFASGETGSCLPIVTIVCMADPATAQGSEMEQLWDEQGWFSASSRLRRVP